jgi:toxin ParE1/3/4
MVDYGISNAAKEDLIRIHQYGVGKFVVIHAEKYFNAFFDYFEMIAERPYSFESVDYIKKGYRRCPCGSDTIYFRITDNVVEIMAIIGMQDLNNLL